MVLKNDQHIIKDLAACYDAAVKSKENQRRIHLMREHNEKRTHEIPMLAELGLWNHWVWQMIAPKLMTELPLARDMEAYFKYWLYMFYEGNDDRPLLPYYSVDAIIDGMPIFGVGPKQTDSNVDGGSYRIDPVICDVADFDLIKKPTLTINEEATTKKVEEAQALVDGNLTIDLCKGPYLRGFNADLSQQLGYLMGIQNFMLFPYLYPEQMHTVLKRMSDSVVELLKRNEAEGHVSRSATFNQSEPYFDDIPAPAANEHWCKLNTLAGFFAAQEYTGVSPKQHEEFLLQYQRPIMELYAHVTYGCCEDLTNKIDILRSVKNLHTIGVTPSANVERCAKQIGQDYIISFRPSPTDTVSTAFDKKNVRELLRSKMACLADSYAHLMLKDVETVGGEPDRIRRFFDIARDEASKIKS